MLRRNLALAVVILLTGCATTPDVRTDSDPAADFSRYRTYTWVYTAPPSGMNPLLFERVHASIDRALSARSFPQATPGDFAVAFTLGRRDSVEVTDFGPYAPFYRGWGVGYRNVDVRNVTEGTLVIDIYDVTTRKPIWHGVATQRIDPQKVDQTAIDGAVDAVLAKFPRSQVRAEHMGPPSQLSAVSSERPERVASEPLPGIPQVDGLPSDIASTQYSRHRTDLSRHRTDLSEHRTDLSEYRTDLSTGRTEMSMRRTGMSFQRTRMSADRTLMSVLRTSLSLIGFGFTIYQAFEKLHEAGTIHRATAPRNFGLALILMGILMLLGGIWRDVSFGIELRRTRGEMIHGHLLHGESRFPISMTLIVAVALLLAGVAATVGIVSNISQSG